MALQGRRKASHTGYLNRSDLAIKYLDEHSLSVAGPKAILSGMRKNWGKDAYVIECGSYLYLVTKETFNYLIP